MEAVGLDLFDFGGKKYLIMVDRYSGYFLHKRLNSVGTSAITDALLHWFGLFGLPIRIRSDNGPQFRGPFMQFCKKYNIEHETSAPYHPESNGLAEAAVKSCKSLMERCQRAGSDFNCALLHWRATPRADGVSPAQAFFQRSFRSLIPLTIHEKTSGDLNINRVQQQQRNFDSRYSRLLSPSNDPTNEEVFVYNPLSKRWDIRATVISGRNSGSLLLRDTNNKTFIRSARHVRRAPS